ncbi:MAG: cation-translocating P-type ATPase [Bacillota bacterium]
MHNKSSIWSIAPVSDLYHHFQVDPHRGLNKEEVRRRRVKYGDNIIQEKKRKGPAGILLDQFKDFMVLVLLGATLISGLLEEYGDALTIIAIVILNALLGFIQEYRSERSFAALKKLSAPRGVVLREENLAEISAEEVVPGDIIVLQAGDRVCADVRLFQAANLFVDESPLTGESQAVEKDASPLRSAPSSPGDAMNMVFSGTLVTSGNGRGVAVATGMETEMGRIATLIQEVEVHSTPLQRRLARLGKILVFCCLLLCCFVAVLGLWRGEDLYTMLLSGISLAVAAIPEGLPAIVTVALALGVQRMLKRKAIVRRLPAVESLGCATFICSDKTGTITQNKMTVKKVSAGGRNFEVSGDGYEPWGGFYQKRSQVNPLKDPVLSRVLLIATLCNNASFNEGKEGKSSGPGICGNPTEGALLVCAAKAGLWRKKLERDYARVEEFPFNADKKYMSVICRHEGEHQLMVKGAPERVLGICTAVLEGGEVKRLDDKRRRQILHEVELMAADALRTIAVAYGLLAAYHPGMQREDVEKELVFCGFFGLIDPPRPRIREAITSCRKAGIRVVMITGDHRNTALAIARQLNILLPGGSAVTGSELDNMSEAELSHRIENIQVYARVNPEHKLRIVRCLKSKGHIVAMTGDGVNDAPAVKEADIGIAMGLTGTDVTKEAASLVLSDDNFNTIVAAVEEGRSIYDNIRKFIRFLLGCNFGEILTMLLAMLWGLPLPLRPIQILWVNLVTDGLPAMALGVDPSGEDTMRRPPRSPAEGVFARGLWVKIISRGILIGGTTVIVFALSLNSSAGLIYAQTMAVVTLVVTQLLHVFECRSEYLPFWEINFKENIFLVLSVLVSFLLLLVIIYHPVMQQVFKTVTLYGRDWSFILAAATFPYVARYLYACLGNIFCRKQVAAGDNL